MKNTLCVLAVCIISLLLSAVAWAACGGPFHYLDPASTTGATSYFAFGAQSDSDGNCAQEVTGVVSTTNGWTKGKTAALSTTVTAVKTSAGQLGSILCYNPNSSAAYVQVFDAATGSVTLGTTSPDYIVPVPPNLANGYVMGAVGAQYSTAISVAATTTPTGMGAPSTGLTCSYLYE